MNFNPDCYGPFRIVEGGVPSAVIYKFAYGEGNGPFEGGQFWAFCPPARDSVFLIKLGTVLQLEDNVEATATEPTQTATEPTPATTTDTTTKFL
jgi:hypothetical protein